LGPFYLAYISGKKAWFNIQRKRLLNQEEVQLVGASHKNLLAEIQTLIPIA
jgi:hypothetical protein